MNRRVLMALRPIYVGMLERGEKRHEYRRCRVGISPGDTVLLYESAPTSMIVGRFLVGRVILGDERMAGGLEACAHVRDAVGAYLAGASVASALEVVDFERFVSPVPLEALGVRSAPMSYSFVKEDAYGRLRDL